MILLYCDNQPLDRNLQPDYDHIYISKLLNRTFKRQIEKKFIFEGFSVWRNSKYANKATLGCMMSTHASNREDVGSVRWSDDHGQKKKWKTLIHGIVMCIW